MSRFVDIGLPGIDGIALTQRVHREAPGTRFVIITMIDVEQEVLARLLQARMHTC